MRNVAFTVQVVHAVTATRHALHTKALLMARDMVAGAQGSEKKSILLTDAAVVMGPAIADKTCCSFPMIYIQQYNR